ncbi:rap guanine nucleotide exchange factor 2 isoform X2 [Ixodes scapularis]
MNSAARKRVGSVGVLTPEERLGKMVTKQKSMDDVLSELRGNAKFLSFGKRSGGTGRRMNECLILEPSEMVVIDYPDCELLRPGQRQSCTTMNLERLLALEPDEVAVETRLPHHHHLQTGGVAAFP